MNYFGNAGLKSNVRFWAEADISIAA